jgi:tetratricopeptide (TPR) repeat protein
MSQVLGRVFRLPISTWNLLRRRPLVTGLAALGLVAVAVFGFFQYAKYQWRKSEIALREDRLPEARERLEFCLIVWPRSPEVHLRAARAARLMGDLRAAEEHLNRCIELQDGASEKVQLEFLLMRVQAGEVDELAPMLAEAIQNGHPESPLILETMARAYLLRLRYKPAYQCISNWIDLQPDSARPYHWRGWVLERLNNPKSATKDYHKALELDPDLMPVRIRVAEMLLEDKQAPEALPHLERLYKQAPNDPLVQARLGMCRFLQGRTEEARKLMEAAVVDLPKDPSLNVALANLDLQEGRAVEAERRLRTVLEADPSDTEALFILGSALQVLDRTAEAKTVLDDYEKKRSTVERINELLKDVADSPTAKPDDYVEIGELFFEIGRDKFGLYWTERALERDPTNQGAHKALASYYQRKGETAKERVHRQQIRVPASSIPPTSSESKGPG